MRRLLVAWSVAWSSPGWAGDVLVNEFMPVRSGSDTDREWVELLNSSAVDQDVSGWRVERALSPGSFAVVWTLPAGTVLSPGARRVVAGPSAQDLPDDTLALSQGEQLGNASGSLSHAVRLVTGAGEVVDVVAYGPGNGTQGGFLDESGVEIGEDRLAPTPVGERSLARIPDGADTDDGAADFQVWDPSRPGLPNEIVCPAPGGVVVNELAYDPPGADANQEWVELVVTGAEPVDLSGWAVQAGRQPTSYGDAFTLPPGTILSPGDFLVVGGELATGLPLDALVQPQGETFGNAVFNSDGARLVNHEGCVIDVVVYGDVNELGETFTNALDEPVTQADLAPRVAEGQTLGRYPDGFDSGVPADDFFVYEGPSPGLPNPPPASDGGEHTGETALGGDTAGLADSGLDADTDGPPADTDPSTSDTDPEEPPPVGAVVLNELLPYLSGADQDREWVELLNVSEDVVDVSGWRVEAATSPGGFATAFAVPEGTSLAPWQRLVVGGLDIADVPAGAVRVAQGTQLGNASGTLSHAARLVTGSGGVVDVVAYGPGNGTRGAFADEQGVAIGEDRLAPSPVVNRSLARIPDGADTDDGSVDFQVRTPPRPGLPNEIVCPAPGEVVINELAYDPPGADGNREWVELVVTGSEPVDVSGWEVQAGLRPDSFALAFALPDGTTIEPGAFLVVGGELAADLPTGAAVQPQGATFGNAVSNSDGAQLVNHEGCVIDVVVYGDVNEPGEIFVNEWGEPVDVAQLGPAVSEGGTIGRYPDGQDTDLSADDFVAYATPSAGQPNPAPGTGEDTDTGDTDVGDTDVGDTDVGDTDPGDTDSGDTDPGDTDAGDTDEGPAPPPAGSVILNELLPELSGSDQDREWVELLNVSAEPWDLSGWRVERATSPGSYSEVFTVPPSTGLGAGERLVLGGLDIADVPADAIRVAQGQQIGNASGMYAHAVRLVTGDGFVMDVVVYGPGNVGRDPFVDEAGQPIEDARIAPRPGSLRSLARLPDGVDTDDSFADFEVLDPPRPGLSNELVCPDPGAVLINELAYDPVGADANTEWAELVVSGTDPVDVSGWALQAALRPGAWGDAFVLPQATQIGPGDHLVVGGEDATGLPTTAILQPQGSTWGNAGSNSDGARLVDDEGCVIDLVVYGDVNEPDEVFVDRQGVEVGDGALAPKASEGGSIGRHPDGVDTEDFSADFAAYGSPSPGVANPAPTSVVGPGGGCVAEIPMLINELFVDPPGTDSDKEWVELGNPEETLVDLSGWTVEAATSPGNWGAAFVVPEGTEIGARGHLTLGGEQADLPSRESILQMAQGSTFGNATSNAAAARLIDPQGCVADVVAYGDANRTEEGDDGVEEERGFLDRQGDPILGDRLGPKPGSEDALARVIDLVDTNDNQVDFVVTAAATPGAANPDLSCKSTAGALVINEFLANPSGADVEAGTEFLEVYNTGEVEQDLSGWQVRSQGRPDLSESVIYTFGPASVVPAGGYRVMGAVFVEEADDLQVDLNLPNGTGSDKVLLYDCEGRVADVVVYGGENSDGHADASGAVEDRVAPRPPDDRCIGRRPDGAGEGRSVDDFTLLPTCTPGESNGEQGEGGSGDPIGPTGCGCGEPQDPGSPELQDPGDPNEPGQSCATVPGRRISLLLGVGMIALLRRRPTGAGTMDASRRGSSSLRRSRTQVRHAPCSSPTT